MYYVDFRGRMNNEGKRCTTSQRLSKDLEVAINNKSDLYSVAHLRVVAGCLMRLIFVLLCDFRSRGGWPSNCCCSQICRTLLEKSRDPARPSSSFGERTPSPFPPSQLEEPFPISGGIFRIGFLFVARLFKVFLEKITKCPAPP